MCLSFETCHELDGLQFSYDSPSLQNIRVSISIIKV